MSGGSFNYVCWSATETEIFSRRADLQSMEEWLRGQGKHDAANEILKFRLQLETFQQIASTMGGRLRDVMHAAEWWCSCDFGEDQFDDAWREFLEGKKK